MKDKDLKFAIINNFITYEKCVYFSIQQIKKMFILDLCSKNINNFLCYKLFILDLCSKNINNFKKNFFFNFQLYVIKLFIMSISTFWNVYIGNIHLLWSYITSRGFASRGYIWPLEVNISNIHNSKCVYCIILLKIGPKNFIWIRSIYRENFLAMILIEIINSPFRTAPALGLHTAKIRNIYISIYIETGIDRVGSPKSWTRNLTPKNG